MPRPPSRPRQVKVWYRGLPYVLDLVKCRRGLVDRQVEGGLNSMESLAGAVGISRSTASRFFAGRATSLAVTLKILAALKLTFEDVAVPEQDSDDPDGPSAVLADPAPMPSRPGTGIPLRLSGGYAG